MLEWATDFFKEKEVPSPRLSIEWLLSYVLQVKRLELYLQYDRPLTRAELDHLKPLILRRSEHEPLQYITGSCDFYNLTLRVTRDVLIPRPETEQLVEKVLLTHTGSRPLKILDIGTGSGCIALSLKKERPDWQVYAIDNSEQALTIARQNAADLKLDVVFTHAGFEQYRPDFKADIIISNPPYIEGEEFKKLDRQVSQFEPENALTTEDVSNVYQQLHFFCQNHLASTGSFYFEINESLGDRLLNICNLEPFHSSLFQDYSNKDRFIIGKFD